MTYSNVLGDRAERTVTAQATGPVVVALKPFDGGESPITMARWLAEWRQVELHAISVIEMGDAGTPVAGLPPFSEEYYQREREEVDADLRSRVGFPCDIRPTRVDVVKGAPGSTVTGTAADRGASTIVVGTGRHGMLGRFLYGERALDVVRSARTAVLVVPPDAAPPIERAIAAVDFSPASVRAATLALEMLGAGGQLTLVHVASAAHHLNGRAGEVEEHGDRRIGALLTRIADALPQSSRVQLESVVLRGDAVGALLRYAEEQEVQLIACGRRRHSLVERLLVGSVSTAVIRGAPCCVLVAPEVGADDGDEVSLLVGETRTSVSPEKWRDLLRGVTDRNAGRRARLTLSPRSEGGVESSDRGYLLLAVDYDRRGGRADIVLGDPQVAGSHLTHRIMGLRRIEVVTDAGGSDRCITFNSGYRDCALEFVDARRCGSDNSTMKSAAGRKP